mgnify:CR=1 FL=1
MAIITPNDLLKSVRDGLAKTPPADVKTVLVHARKVLRGTDASSTTEEADDLKEALTWAKQSATVIASAGAASVDVAIANIAKAWPTLVEDDVAPGSVDRKKLRTNVRRVLTEAGALGASGTWLVNRIEDLKRRIMADHQATDPCETVFAAQRAILAAPPSPEAVAAAWRIVESKRHLLAPDPIV